MLKSNGANLLKQRHKMAGFCFSPFPVLLTERLVLDRTVDADAHHLYLLRSNDGVMRYVERPRPQNDDDALANIRSMDQKIIDNEAIAWAIRIKGNPELIGVIGYWRAKPEHYRAEVGYMIMPEYWGRGITSEALMAVLEYGFSEMQLHSVEADINPDNVASRKVLLKAGFKSEAFFRENYFWQGRFYNSEIFGLIASEFRLQKRSSSIPSVFTNTRRHS
jgi:ribosomal-protein-alanine N-acetyltransferase